MNDIELLKNSRKALNLNQDKLAARLGVNKISISRWETGARSPSPEIFKQLLKMIVQRNITNQERTAFIESTANRLKHH